MVEQFKRNNVEGDAADWTPRQALLHALTHCDEWEGCVIMAVRKDGAPHGVNATKNRFIRGGLLAYALGDVWDDGEDAA